MIHSDSASVRPTQLLTRNASNASHSSGCSAGISLNQPRASTVPGPFLPGPACALARHQSALDSRRAATPDAGSGSIGNASCGDH
jgi:hypothetical protein